MWPVLYVFPNVYIMSKETWPREVWINLWINYLIIKHSASFMKQKSTVLPEKVISEILSIVLLVHVTWPPDTHEIAQWKCSARVFTFVSSF